MISEQELKQFAPNAREIILPTVTKWFNEFAGEHEITTPLRIAAFFSQIIHESGSFRYTQEIASGKDYEGRKDLGNIHPGDGEKYKGRGYIQITGRTNYAALSKDLFDDPRLLLDNPGMLASPKYAMLSAMWFWDSRKLNKLADIQYLKTITKRINGGYNGWDERLHIYNRICDIYSLPHWQP